MSRLAHILNAPSPPSTPPPSESNDTVILGRRLPGHSSSSLMPSRSASPELNSSFGSPVRPQTLALEPPAASLRRKRPAEDDSQYIDNISRSLKLKPSSSQELRKFAKLSHGERDIYFAARLLKLDEQQEALTPPDTLYIIPKALESKIEEKAFATLMNHTLSCYTGKSANAPVQLLQDLILDNPSWGATKAVKDDKSKWSVIVKRIQSRLTDRRYDIKAALAASLGKPDDDSDIEGMHTGAVPISKLCENLVKIYLPSNISTSIELCARVAFLRQVLLGVGVKNNKYWEKVDEELAGIRESNKNDEVLISKCFGKILQHDRKCFSSVE